MKTQPSEPIALNPHPDCDNCNGTGWVEWTNKRKEVHGQPCYKCEELWASARSATMREP